MIISSNSDSFKDSLDFFTLIDLNVKSARLEILFSFINKKQLKSKNNVLMQIIKVELGCTWITIKSITKVTREPVWSIILKIF